MQRMQIHVFSPSSAKFGVTTDLTDQLESIIAQLECGTGIVRAEGLDRYTLTVNIGEAFRWNEGPLDTVTETLKEVLDYNNPEIVVSSAIG